jgi:hypothetical protein
MLRLNAPRGNRTSVDDNPETGRFHQQRVEAETDSAVGQGEMRRQESAEQRDLMIGEAGDTDATISHRCVTPAIT